MIVPNRRPWRYFSQLYANEKRAGALPRMLPFSELASLWCATVRPVPYIMANPLDEVFVLRQCVNELSEEDVALSRYFASMDMAAFLPWGMRLANLIDEIYFQGKQPRDLENVEAQPAASALLAALGRISALYRKKLEQVRPELMTSGLECLIAAENASSIPEYVRPSPQRPVLIAGFSRLDGAENKIFQSLWEAGAIVCAHADPALIRGKKHEEAATPIAAWLEKWKATAVEACQGGTAEPEYSFYAAYDTHSQIRQLAADFRDAGSISASTAIILPSAELLMPVLHHLPADQINVSMGYPLKRAQLNSFISDIFKLQLNRRPDGRYYWRDLLNLMGQTYLSILADSQGIRLSNALWKLKNRIRQNETRYVDLQALKAGLDLEPAEAAYLDTVLAILVDNMAALRTPGEMARALEAICNLLINDGGKGWKYFPLDAEALSRLQNRILPVLLNNPLRDEIFSLPVLYRLLDNLLESERIPFEAEPLLGAQILGLYETRLLHFDNLYILDASDDRLPGSKGQDPLLPDELRLAAGLPNAGIREEIAAYHLHRLMAGAKKVHFYWAEGGTLSDSSSGKRFRSRFVERLLWREEQKLGRILKPGDATLRSAQSMASARKSNFAPLRRGPNISAAMDALLGRPLSATRLNTYLACPAAFVMDNLLKLQPPAEVNEGDDYAGSGKCIHTTLAQILEPYLGQVIKLSDIEPETIKAAFEKEMLRHGMSEKLPTDSWLMFRHNGNRQLQKYFQSQNEEVLIKAIETKTTRDIFLNGRIYKFEGTLDRVDIRDSEKYVIDYKTGAIHAPGQDLWTDETFFAALSEYVESHPDEFDDRGDELLLELAAKFPDVQLGLYLLLTDAANASYIELREKCKEVPFFSPDGLVAREKVLESCKIAIAFILAHMERTQVFKPLGQKCDYCDHAATCKA